MKYYICEGKPDGEYNATSKARKDVENILSEIKIKKYYIPTKYGVQKNKILKIIQLYTYYKNYKIWSKEISKLKEEDIIIIQYPLVNTILNFDKIIDKCNRKRITTIAVIHDLDSLRSKNMRRINKEDNEVLKRCSYIIAHNYRMQDELVNKGCDKEKIVNLEIFDYLTETEIENKKRVKDDAIIIAGNLSKEKACYLKGLKNLKDIKFNLYGKGYEKEENEENVNYKGAFLPEELLNHLEGSFGLIWDGESTESCLGLFGSYLKYNNPHKTSLYLTAELPVIVWNESAMSKFVIENNIGITVGCLDEINEKVKKLTESDYYEMVKNTKSISDKLRKGEYLKTAIKKVFYRIEGKENE